MREIIDLDQRLQAISTLENLRFAIQGMDNLDRASTTGQFVLIQYDNRTMRVSISIYGPQKGFKAYDKLEFTEDQISGGHVNAVLVEADKAENLKKAYPNYFGDVANFTKNLKRIVKGKDAEEYVLPPATRAPPPPREVPDDSWFRYRGRRR